MKMMTVKEFAEMTGVSVRTLQYYDEIGLLPPANRSESGYRLYDDESLERLQQILLFRVLEFSLDDIGKIVGDPHFDKMRALEQQIELLTLKKEHLENLILLAKGMKMRGVNHMDLTAFDTKKIDEYAKQARESWGDTAAYKEFEEKRRNRSKTEETMLASELMDIFGEFGKIKDSDPGSEKAQALVSTLRDFISKHYYNCNNDMLMSLGRLYSGGGDFTKNIDAKGGEGTGEFVRRAIDIFTK